MYKTSTLTIRTLFLTLVIFIFSSCASTRPPGTTHFHSRITSTGLKHFQVTIMQAPRGDRESGRNSNRNPSRINPEERAANRAEKILIETTERKILETQFCREGYWFLGNNFYGRKVYIRGECNETATEADREKFPDTLLYW